VDARRPGQLFAVPDAPAAKCEYVVPSATEPHDTPIVSERRFAVPNDVTVEAVERDTFLVSRTRHGGTTTAAVFYTRAELEQLLKRIPAALAVG